MSQLADIQSAGGFWTVVMGRNVRVVPWLHIASGDIVGQIDMVGHYNAHGNTANPNRTCHCSHEEMDNPQPECQLVTVEEIDTAYANNDLQAFKAMSIHPIKSCFVGVPLSCQKSWNFRNCTSLLTSYHGWRNNEVPICMCRPAHWSRQKQA